MIPLPAVSSAGMLDDRLNSDIAEPIQLGVLAAKGRMRSFDYENPYLEYTEIDQCFLKLYNNFFKCC